MRYPNRSDHHGHAPTAAFWRRRAPPPRDLRARHDVESAGHAVIVAGLQDWDYKGSQWRPVEEERLVALLRQQLGPKLSQNFFRLAPPSAIPTARV